MYISNLSPSSYKKYHFCEFQWYLRYIMGFEDSSIPSGLLGSASHYAMEILSKQNIRNKNFIDPELLWELCYEREKTRQPDVALRVKKADYKAVKKAFLVMMEDPLYSPLTSNIISTEQPFTIKIPEIELDINGIIDRVQIIDNIKYIFDLKTGRKAEFGKEDTGEKMAEDMWDDIQIQMYALAAHLMFPDDKEFYAVLYYMKHTPIMIRASDMNPKDIIEKIIKFINKVRQNNTPRRSLGWWCKHMCPYGSKTKICENTYNDITIFGREVVESLHRDAHRKDQKDFEYISGEQKFNNEKTIIGIYDTKGNIIS